MSQRFGALSLALLALAAGVARADDEPMFRDRPLSAWLAVLTGDPLARHRQGALVALETIGAGKSPKVVPAVAAALTAADQDEAVRLRAAETLGRMYDRVQDEGGAVKWDPARDGLAAALRADKSPLVRQAAAASLGHMGGDAAQATPGLAAALKDAAPEVRSAAADALRRVAVNKEAAKDVAAALPDLEKLLKDKGADHFGRAAAALAIGQVGAPDGVAALGALADAAADAQAPADVRKAAVEALGRFGEDAGPAAGKLADVLAAADAPAELRRAAAGALDRLGPAAKPALPALEKAVGGDDPFVRVVALHTLGRLGAGLGAEARGVVAVMLPRVDDDVIEVRVAAIQAVGAFGRDALGMDLERALDLLNAAAGDARPEVRAAAAAALGKLKANP